MLLILLWILSPQLKAVSIIEDEWIKVITANKEKLANSPDDIKARFRLAVAYANLGDLKSAMNELKNLQKLDGKKMTREIIREYELEYKKNTENLFTLNYLAFAYYANGQFNKSKIFFQKIIELDAENIWAYNYLALVQGILEDYDEAIKTLKKAIKIEKNNYTYLILGLIYYQKGQLFKAMWYMGKSGNIGLDFLNDES